MSLSSVLPALPYDTGTFWDEMFEADGVPRAHYQRLVAQLATLSPEQVSRRQAAADHSFHSRCILQLPVAGKAHDVENRQFVGHARGIGHRNARAPVNGTSTRSPIRPSHVAPEVTCSTRGNEAGIAGLRVVQH